MNQKADSFLSISSVTSLSNFPTDNSFDLKAKISPTAIYAITLISVIFFVSALLHLLVRFLLRSRTRLNDAYEETASAMDMQGQVQTMFNLHDTGVDQSFIDALPLFHYKKIIGLRHDVPFDCPVCLCEFKPEDELRLLPKCSHAFHVGCIDTWLLTNSICPLCRDNLVLSVTALSSPVFLLLESDGESFQDSGSHLGSIIHFDDVGLKASDISVEHDECKPENDERVVLV
ncbi:hypothetical protein EUTSA_v10014578mg [Eutrema salsugineum]|uniref:RING-type E3 ubiquitin transferase n=1 Tax=Eutrema salsugineum TaxID=72664 RepID=V4NA11_EUTSA|nr:putative RING-H2 finger protein ATL50 [Eutrema salsugineum]XP_024012637.1 putative RING-H2 finger protein ATL50 [Eutrema salsugineum]ESQ42626.1 hypothetical protein EUTSA_v10014578mg [Eutrema salsugineum]